MILNKKQTTVLLFVFVCLIGSTIGYYLYTLYPVFGLWTFFSILLVLAPDRKDVMPLAINRIKANLIGGSVGLTLFAIHPPNLFIICLGIAVAIIICEFLALQAATRSATIAVLIVIIHEPGKHFWDVALERAGGVLLGCVIGVALTYLFHIAIVKSKQTIQRIKHK